MSDELREGKYLIGYNDEGCAVLAEVRRYEDGSFAASFDEYHDVDDSEFDAYSYAEQYVDSADDTEKLRLLERFDCRPSELVDELADDQHNPCDWLDLSSELEFEDKDNHHHAFEFVTGGQHDPRKDLGFHPYDEEAVGDLLKYWEIHHLKYVMKGSYDALVAKLDAMAEKQRAEGGIEAILEKWFKAE